MAQVVWDKLLRIYPPETSLSYQNRCRLEVEDQAKTLIYNIVLYLLSMEAYLRIIVIFIIHI